MRWQDRVLDKLSSCGAWGYAPHDPAATEPAAYSALALIAAARWRNAMSPLGWLLHLQAADGSVGVSATQATPIWTTSLAMLAWHAASAVTEYDRSLRAELKNAASKGLETLLANVGETWERKTGAGHDPSLQGWPWVQGTHSWSEPTALALLAMKRSGMGEHARAREAAKLLIDRLLPEGGCNYGNTEVLGQRLRPHVGPTGLALTALAGEEDRDGKIDRSLGWLEETLSRQLGVISRCHAIHGLVAHGRDDSIEDSILESVADSALKSNPSPHSLSLLALAGMGTGSPLIDWSSTLDEVHA